MQKEFRILRLFRRSAEAIACSVCKFDLERQGWRELYVSIDARDI
jgi:hypothetical protein